jgi:pyrroloquinoline quinone biosynthesis protein D
MYKIQRNPNVMWREEKDALATVSEGLDRGDDVEDLGTAVLFSGGTMLSINFLGTEIWKLCDGRDMDGIVAELLERFDVEEDVLRQDIGSFIAELSGKGFITHEN